MSEHAPFADAQSLKEYATAGRAVLTLVSDKTDARYTYRISPPKDSDDRFFVALLTGPDNVGDYTYLGMIFPDGFRVTKASKFGAESTPVRAFAYFWKHVAAGQMAPQVTVYHEGHCGRCGRALTVPSSVQSGIGPECAKKMGG